jgi:thioredoxin-related protein
MKKVFLLAIVAIAIIATAFTAPSKKAPKKLVKWYTWEEAMKANDAQPRKIFVDLYTDWCGWCKVMDSKTFEDPKVAEYLNTYYYPVKFNAEQTAAVTFKGKVYPGEKGKMHALAAWLTGGKASYRTVVYLDENVTKIQAIEGYREVAEFSQISRYFGEDFYKTMNWATFKTQK